MRRLVADMLNSDQNLQVSDTTEADRSNKNHIIKIKKYNHEK